LIFSKGESVELLTIEGVKFLLRWIHIFFGVIWIGLLYYFNFVHGSFMKEAGAPSKPDVVTKLLPRALWWFRWGAFWTMTTGLILILHLTHERGLENSWGVKIWTGAVLGLTMAANVWFVIWPNQKVVIKNAEETAAGRPALPNAAASAAKALLASRTNTLFSIPMLYYMAAASHLPTQINEGAAFNTYFGVFAVILVAIEANALKGKLGPLETIKGVVTCGFILTAILHIAQSVIL
jgi:uncharacterized membrane protein